MLIYFDKYDITEEGKISNVKTKHEMKPSVNSCGYKTIVLSYEGHWKSFKVHRLVAETYIQNPDNKSTVNHKDGNKLNNHVSNLEWATRSENQLHCVNVLGKGGRKQKIPKEEYANIIEKHKTMNCSQIAIEYGVSRKPIERIINGKGR
jgi:hypothetical protein